MCMIICDFLMGVSEFLLKRLYRGKKKKIVIGLFSEARQRKESFAWHEKTDKAHIVRESILSVFLEIDENQSTSGHVFVVTTWLYHNTYPYVKANGQMVVGLYSNVLARGQMFVAYPDKNPNCRGTS
ncbi:hypothetical protein E3N88_39350 [Mikania micrantha]|uniref:Uncharacterized protein n=1 Tax=Mikania micrantha TaxID=192012 RepID=A0A5N6LWI2_9ASTR|nr:hypothetical protein E3N88_39350 [Mikania micrantha]